MNYGGEVVHPKPPLPKVSHKRSLFGMQRGAKMSLVPNELI